MRTDILTIRTKGRGFIELTGLLHDWLGRQPSPCQAGLLNLFIRHTSASLVICENADPDVLRDLECWMGDLAADGDPRFRHRAEGPDDMPAHIRSVLTQTSLSLPLRDGQLALGTWQGVFLWEHRHAGHRREVLLTLMAA